MALSRESRATTLPALANGGNLKLATVKTDLGPVPRIGLGVGVELVVGLVVGLGLGPGLGRLLSE